MYGGFLCVGSTANVTLSDNVAFESNEAAYGGVIAFQSEEIPLSLLSPTVEPNPVMNLSASSLVTFASNSALVSGGVGYFEILEELIAQPDRNVSTQNSTESMVDNVTIVLKGGVFINKTARESGGVFSFQTADEINNDSPSLVVEVSDSVFSKNRACLGGALAVQRGHMSLFNSSFVASRAYFGGAIYAGPGGQADCTLISATDTKALGGGLLFNQAGSHAAIHNADVSGVESVSQPDALQDSVLVGEGVCGTLEVFSWSHGGAFYVSSTAGLVIDGSSLQCSAEGKGGCIYLNTLAGLNITGGAVNSSADSGGFIFSESQSAAHIVGLESSKSSADSGGFAFISSEASLQLELSIISSAALSVGGALTLGTRASCLMRNVSINSVAGDLGGLAYLNLRSELSMENVQGARYVENDLRIETELLTPYNGGALYQEAGSIVAVSSCSFEKYLSKRNGGFAFLQENSQLLLSTATVAECECSRGGALYLNDGCSLTVNSANVLSSSAEIAGGMCLHPDSACMYWSASCQT